MHFIILLLIKTTSQLVCLKPIIFDLVCSHTAVFGFTQSHTMKTAPDVSPWGEADICPWKFSPDPGIIVLYTKSLRAVKIRHVTNFWSHRLGNWTERVNWHCYWHHTALTWESEAKAVNPKKVKVCLHFVSSTVMRMCLDQRKNGAESLKWQKI